MSAIESAHIVTVFDAGTEDVAPSDVTGLLTTGENVLGGVTAYRLVSVDVNLHQ